MSLILDVGALLAIERGDVHVSALLKREFSGRRVPVTHAGVVGQVWRGGGARQTLLARLLSAIRIEPLDEPLARRAGTLLAGSRKRDVIDAAVVLIASDGDWILTSDPEDLVPLVAAARLHVDVVPV